MNLYQTELLNPCRLCPRRCGAKRLEGERGQCGATDELLIALATKHEWEEPCISGMGGSGAVFFSNCSLRCVYCQNDSISHHGAGVVQSAEQLSEIFQNLFHMGVSNIELITATQYIPWWIPALADAKKKGVNLPIIYNTGGYERPEILRLLKGQIDVYLPDVKYYDPNLANRYSAAPDYFYFVTTSLDEMLHQVGVPKWKKDGTLQKGVLVRHLVLPGCYDDSKRILEYLFSRYQNDILYSLMSQYTPMPNCKDFSELNRPILATEYLRLVEFAKRMGIETLFIQEDSSACEEYIPNFDGTGTMK